jgi:hypothetical protein
MFLPQNQYPEETMPNNLQLYHEMRRQFCQWLPNERSTRIRNKALFITGLYLRAQPHLSKIVRKWPVLEKLPSLTNRFWRFFEQSQSDCRSLVCSDYKTDSSLFGSGAYLTGGRYDESRVLSSFTDNCCGFQETQLAVGLVGTPGVKRAYYSD